MECAFCKQTMEGCACIKCSECSSQYHVECACRDLLAPSSNTWRCCRCEAARLAQAAPMVDANA